jgi:hypothetical protein
MPRRANEAELLYGVVRVLIWAKRRELGLATGKPPYGFKIAGRPGYKRLVPCPHTRACGRKFLEWREKGYSWSEIYNHVWMIKMRTRDGREWSEGAIKRAVNGERALLEEEARMA